MHQVTNRGIGGGWTLNGQVLLMIVVAIVISTSLLFPGGHDDKDVPAAGTLNDMAGRKNQAIAADRLIWGAPANAWQRAPAYSSRRMISAPALNARSLPLAT